MTSRDPGILTEKQRRFLKADEKKKHGKFTRQERYRLRKTIKKRTRNAILDFGLLASSLDDDTLEDILDPDFETVEDEEGATLVRRNIQEEMMNIHAGVEFLIRASLAADTRDHNFAVGVERALSGFTRDVEFGVQAYLNHHQDLVGDIDVSISVENLRYVDDYYEELKERDGRVSGQERIDAFSRLGRAGYTHEEIIGVVGPTETDGE